MPSRHDEVVRHLIDDLAHGRYAAGLPLASIHDLAGRLGAAPGTVREALRTLQGKGMVESRPGKGHLARPDDRWRIGDRDVLLAMLESGGDPALLREVVEARAAIECAAVERTGGRPAFGDLALLSDRVREMEQASAAPGRAAGLEDPFVQAESGFHHALVLIGGNRVLASVAEPLHAVLATMRLRRAPDRERAAIGQHRRILEGMSSGDPRLAVSSVKGYGQWLERRLAGRP